MNHQEKRGRLLVLSQMYRPEPNFITSDVAQAMARHMDVVAVTALPNYPFGRFYPGVRPWWPTRTRENGVTVWRLPFFPYQGKSQARRAISYLSFAFMAAVWAPFVGGRPDVVWIYHGPFSAAPAALWFKLLHRSRLVLTCADLWPETFLAAGVAGPGLVMRLLFAYRRAVNRAMDAIICSTQGTLDRFADEGVDRARLQYVPVWVDGIGGAAAPASGLDEPRRIVYAGSLGPAQAIDTLIQAAAQCRRQGIDAAFDIYGTGSCEQELRKMAHDTGATNVTFHGRISPETAFEVSSRAFAQVVSLQRSPLFAMSVPSKISFCCAAGAPILYGLQGEPAQMVDASGGGIAFDVSDPGTLVQAIETLIARSPEDRRQMRASLQRYYSEHLAKPMLIARYEQILLSHLAGAPHQAPPALARNQPS